MSCKVAPEQAFRASLSFAPSVQERSNQVKDEPEKVAKKSVILATFREERLEAIAISRKKWWHDKRNHQANSAAGPAK
jgi:hypothetical protein